RLSQLKLPIDELLDIVERAAGENRACNKNDPVTAPGYETWRWATRFVRESQILRDLGWTRCAHKLVDGLRHDGLRIKLVISNMDSAAGDPDRKPKSKSEKGSASASAIANNASRDQMNFWPSAENEDDVDEYDFWYLGIHVGENCVTAEVSRPIGMVSKLVNDYSERLVVAREGDLPLVTRPETVPQDFAEVELPKVTRKTN
ncbi:hypothetical protein, partial [Henriciella sp.]|uniref:hypothetical protein n=1 Tax=Henriciella sp. TaxID=1968823 RepID=UPI0025BF386B